MDNLINIGIIVGGKSVESEISLISGSQAYFNLDDEKYHKKIFYLDKNNQIYIVQNFKNINSFVKENLKEVGLRNIYNQVYYYTFDKPKKVYPIDVFIPVVHGYGVEDGTISGFLDIYNATYTSSSLISSAIIQDKIVTKLSLDKYKVDNIEYQILLNPDDKITLELPLIVKPAYLGSSIGINIATNKQELKDAINEAFKYGNKVLVEKYLQNFLEYNCAIIKNKNEYLTSMIEEVKHSQKILSFEDKYINENKSSNHLLKANINKELEEKIKNLTIKLYQIFNLSGIVRVDYLYDLEKEKLYVNEINNIPGSLAYYLFTENLSFKQLLDILIHNAIVKKHQDNQLITSFKSNVLNFKGKKLNK